MSIMNSFVSVVNQTLEGKQLDNEGVSVSKEQDELLTQGFLSSAGWPNVVETKTEMETTTKLATTTNRKERNQTYQNNIEYNSATTAIAKLRLIYISRPRVFLI